MPLLLLYCLSLACLATPALSLNPVVLATGPKPVPLVALPPVPGSKCVFPFWWKNHWRHTCVQYNLKGEQWCSITTNFTRDENWRRCESHDTKRFHCTVPFTFGGRKHYSCLPLTLTGGGAPSSATAYWCALRPAIASAAAVTWAGADWAFCESPNATTADYLKAIGPHRDLAEARAAAVAKIIAGQGAAVKTDQAAVAAAAKKDSMVGGSSPGGGGASGWAAGLVAGLGVACALLAAAVATAAWTVHRKYIRGRYKRIEPLLASDSIDKSSYGGIEAYHD